MITEAQVRTIIRHELRLALSRASHDRAEEVVREMMWHGHGHVGLYGDDGEMQCGVCRCDYKRDPMARLLECWNASAWERLVIARARLEVEVAVKLWRSTQNHGDEHLNACALLTAVDRLLAVEAQWKGRVT